MSKSNESAQTNSPSPESGPFLNFQVSVPGVGVEVRDVGEKIGSVFGERGAQYGRELDNVTKDVTIRIPY